MKNWNFTMSYIINKHSKLNQVEIYFIILIKSILNQKQIINLL
jgi:hypothetical protein